MIKEELINKIASCIGVEDTGPNTEKQALKVASKMLKLAADNQKVLETKIEQLSSENEQLKRIKHESAKKERIEMLVEDMFNKDLIKKSQIESKIHELMSADENTIVMMEEMVESIPEKTAEECAEGLTFLCSNNNIEEETKSSMADSMGRFIR